MGRVGVLRREVQGTGWKARGVGRGRGGVSGCGGAFGMGRVAGAILGLQEHGEFVILGRADTINT